MKLKIAVIFALLFGMVGYVNAGTIDFENLPVSLQVDDAGFGDPNTSGTINNFYWTNDGVKFSTLTPGVNGLQLGTPILESVGPDGTEAFWTTSTGNPGYELAHQGDLGSYLLKGKLNAVGAGITGLRIEFADPVAQAMGEIWDIDGNRYGTEGWVVTAFDENGNPIYTVDSPIGSTDGASSLDGKPWLWNLGGGQLISWVDVVFSDDAGMKTSNLGVAFDNLNWLPGQAGNIPTPEPATMAMWGALALLGTAVGRRRRQK